MCIYACIYIYTHIHTHIYRGVYIYIYTGLIFYVLLRLGLTFTFESKYNSHNCKIIPASKCIDGSTFYMILLPSSLLNSVFSLVWTVPLFISYILLSCSLVFFYSRKFMNAAFPALSLCLIISNAILAEYNILSPAELNKYCSIIF